MYVNRLREYISDFNLQVWILLHDFIYRSGTLLMNLVSHISIVVPPIDFISKLDTQLQPIMLQQQISKNLNQELTQLRDWLLPMLMNGQVKVE